LKRLGHSKAMWSTVCFSAPQSHSGEFPMPRLGKESVHLPWEIRTLFSVRHKLRGGSKPVGVCPGDILHKRLSRSTAAARVRFRLAIISESVSDKSIAVFIARISRLQSRIIVTCNKYHVSDTIVIHRVPDTVEKSIVWRETPLCTQRAYN